VYIGSLGAHLYDDEVLVDAASGLFSGETYKALLTDGAVDAGEGSFTINIYGLVEADPGTYTIGDTTFVVVDASVGSFDLYLPAAGTENGRIIVVNRADENFDAVVVVYPSNSEPNAQIDNEDFQKLYPGDSMALFSYNGNWRVW
jgi:hypothetical protein